MLGWFTTKSRYPQYDPEKRWKFGAAPLLEDVLRQHYRSNVRLVFQDFRDPAASPTGKLILTVEEAAVRRVSNPLFVKWHDEVAFSQAIDGRLEIAILKSRGNRQTSYRSNAAETYHRVAKHLYEYEDLFYAVHLSRKAFHYVMKPCEKWRESAWHEFIDQIEGSLKVPTEANIKQYLEDCYLWREP